MLDREEYIEQAYFFRTFRERLEEDLPAQEILASISEEILATTRLPMALEFLRGEILLKGRISDGMARLQHYFTPFQTFVLAKAEEDRARFDQRIALEILEREADYRAKDPAPAGLFVYQFECVSRHKLGYDRGMVAIAGDPLYDADWKDWIVKARLRLGTVEFPDMIYYRSEFYAQERRRDMGNPDWVPSWPLLFATQEGRIARANRGKDPLYLFAALQRQLGYPSVPRHERPGSGPLLHPALEARLQRLEQRLQLLESETKGQLDLSQFYARPPDPPAEATP